MIRSKAIILSRSVPKLSAMIRVPETALIIAQKIGGARSQFYENDFAVGNVDNVDNADKKMRVQFC